ncbi:MAG: tetratricopeptide repeat protein [Anaerolineaceae bacterium]|nr:tetratricopeptide repeat protein [Anaerolineaceae bacterium]MCB9098284.1 tetratricopeptide repeat protein [Anaerolineales bacterium]
MPTPVLTTKLYIPQPRPELVPRPRLLQKLTDGLTPQRRLTLVSAPAGFGKTTLVSHWLTQTDGGETMDVEPKTHLSSFIIHHSDVAWLTLEESDNDLGRFLTYMVAALQQVEPDVGQTVRGALQAAQLPPVESLLTALINDIAALDRYIVLVLDDYHTIESDDVHEALSFLMEHLPRQLHIVMTTRVDPPLPLARWRVRGQITEIRLADLRFNNKEMATFLNERMGLSLSPDDICVLEERTEGWIAGLQLAALSMQRVQDVSVFIKSFAGSHHYVVEYLVDEVLNQQPEAIKRFLLKTSILERLSWPLCAVVMGEADVKNEEISNEEFRNKSTEISAIDPIQTSLISSPPSPISNLPSPHLQSLTSSQEILNYLVHANLFIVPLDNEWRWFRYHQLFAQVLQNRLQHTVDAPEIIWLKLQASQWCEHQGFIGEAIRYALAAGKVDRAAELIETHARPLMMRGQIATIKRWMGVLPPKEIAARPRLGLIEASLELVSSDYANLAVRIEEVDQALQKDRPLEPDAAFNDLQSELLTYNAVLLVTQNKFPEAIAQAKQALAHADVSNFYLQGFITLIWAGAVFNNKQEKEALSLLRKSIELSEKAGSLFWALLGIAKLAQFQDLTGELRAAEMLYRQAVQLASQEQDQHSPGVSFAYDGLGQIYSEWNRLDEAAAYLEQAIKLSDVGGLKIGSMMDRLHLALVCQYQRKAERVEQLVSEAEKILQEISHPFAEHVLCLLKIRLLLAQGKLAEAAQWGRKLDKNLSSDDPWIVAENTGAALARIYIVQARLRPESDSLDKALELLAKLTRQAKSLGRLSYLIEGLVLQALAHQLKGNIDPAVSMLADALRLGQPEGYFRVFVNEGQPMAHLLSELQTRQPTYAAYTQQLRAAILQEQPPKDEAPLPVSTLSPAEPLVESLSERELEVLRLVAAGSSNSQIAKVLIIAQGTVKKHLSNIFGKLNAESRTQAVARGRELGLLE